MAAAKPDRRTERTRAALMSAFIDVLLTEGYDAVTVEAVAARANVGRSTFYMHYTGKEDILKQSMTRPSSHLAVIVGHDVSPEMLVPILVHFQDQRKLNRVFFGGAVRAIWVKCLAEMIEPRLSALSRHVRGRPVIPLSMISLHLAEAQIALVAHWLTAGPATKPAAIAEALIASTRAAMAALLRVDRDAPLFIPGEKPRVVHAGQDRP